MAFPNKYRSTCANCGGVVEPRKGVMTKSNGKWTAYHKDGDCIAERPKINVDFDEYQSAIIDAIVGKGDDILIDAKAGTGKTTVKCHALNKLYERSGARILAMAFGNEDGHRLRSKLDPDIEGRTSHSLCMDIVRSAYKATLNKTKQRDVIEAVVGPDDKYIQTRQWVNDLLEKVKADAVVCGDKMGMANCAVSYELEIPEAELGGVIALADKCLEVGDDLKKWGFDFNDALYFVATRNLKVPNFGVVGCDEIQDFNECQLRLLQKFRDGGSRIVAVGDPFQSLYAFRGARHDSFDRMRDLLNGLELPMPVSYRCSQAVIKLAQTIVPEIQSRKDAPLGNTTNTFAIARMPELLGNEDLVLCRTNAPLVRLAWLLISLDKPFYMRGGRQEAGLLSWYVDMFCGLGPATTEVGEVLNRGQKWLAERKCSGYRKAEHQGRLEVLTLIGNRCLEVADLKKAIWRLFDRPEGEGATLSTIHRAKGSEAKRVYHISPELVPHPKATTEEQKQQEMNAQYVGYTRAIDEYIETVGELSEVSDAA